MGFKPGQSGNPAGRPKGVANQHKLRGIITKDLPAILQTLADLAKAGDTAAAKLLLDRCLPALKPQDQPVSLPLGDDLTQAATAVLNALAAGTVTPDQAATVAATIGALARTRDAAELERRIFNLEELLNATPQQHQ